MSTIRGVKDRRFKFVQILNSMFEDINISLKAKGFIGFCLTKKQDWDFHISHLCSVLKEGEDAVYSTIKECIDNGYAYRYRTRDAKGKLTEVEYLISDSKEEILSIKTERDPTNEFNKKVPQRENPGVDSPRPENPGVDFPREIPVPIYSNTDISNTEEQQQQKAKAAAAPLPKEEKKSHKPNIHDILLKIDIPESDKIEITEKYPSAEIVRKALDWALHPETTLTKGLAPALKWACKYQPEMPISKKPKEEKTKVDPTSYNKCYWRNINTALFKLGIKPNVNEHEDDRYLKVQGNKIFYKDMSFLEQISNLLRKMSVQEVSIFKMIGGFQYDLSMQ